MYVYVFVFVFICRSSNHITNTRTSVELQCEHHYLRPTVTTWKLESKNTVSTYRQHYRLPKIVLPTLTFVLPNEIAKSKSEDIPILNSIASVLRFRAAHTSSRHCTNDSKSSVASPPYFPIVIKPRKFKCGHCN